MKASRYEGTALVDPTQFISLKELATFSGQMLVAGTFAELFKRVIPTMDDGLNRILITAGAVTVNFIAAIGQSMPVGGQAWAGTLLLSLVNGFVIALASMKSIEFIAERKVREIARNGGPPTPPAPPPEPPVVTTATVPPPITPTPSKPTGWE